MNKKHRNTRLQEKYPNFKQNEFEHNYLGVLVQIHLTSQRNNQK